MKERKNHRLDNHLNLNVRGMGSSATLAINERSAELCRQGRQVFKLGLGQSPFPVPDSVVETLKANAHQKDYLPVKGLPKLREAVAEYHQRRHGVSRSGADVLIGPGSKELMFLLQLAYYGDLVIPTPSWVSYAPQARIIGRQVRWLSTSPRDEWRLTAEELARLAEEDLGRPRIVILNYPSNPTGSTYRTERLKRLAKVAREHRMILLSDAMTAVASETYTSTSAPIQYAAVRAFQGGSDIEEYLWHARHVCPMSISVALPHSSRRANRQNKNWASVSCNSIAAACCRPSTVSVSGHMPVEHVTSNGAFHQTRDGHPRIGQWGRIRSRNPRQSSSSPLRGPIKMCPRWPNIDHRGNKLKRASIRQTKFFGANGRIRNQHPGRCCIPT